MLLKTINKQIKTRPATGFQFQLCFLAFLAAEQMLVFQHPFGFLPGNRPADQITLEMIAAAMSQIIQLFRCLHTFSYYQQANIVRHLYDGLDQHSFRALPSSLPQNPFA
jgi:flagellar biosynthesis protein FliR